MPTLRRVKVVSLSDGSGGPPAVAGASSGGGSNNAVGYVVVDSLVPISHTCRATGPGEADVRHAVAVKNEDGYGGGGLDTAGSASSGDATLRAVPPPGAFDEYSSEEKIRRKRKTLSKSAEAGDATGRRKKAKKTNEVRGDIVELAGTGVSEGASDRKLSHYEQKWMQRFHELKQYKHAHGDCNVSQNDKVHPQLATWVHTQRTQYRFLNEGKKSLLTKERISMLESLGFKWWRSSGFVSRQQNSWEQLLKELVQYKAEHGDCNVPRRWKQNPELANWVKEQRTQHRLLKEGKASHMTEERIDMLESIGFHWSRRHVAHSWEKRFEELKHYKAKHGNCNVTRGRSENPQLANWVQNQRSQYRLFMDGKKSQLTEDRIDMMESVGFTWSMARTPWEQRFEELMQYKAERGDCDVPSHLKPNHQLAAWVAAQRTYLGEKRRTGALTKANSEKIGRLESLGFRC